jgi:hypothetical protein
MYKYRKVVKSELVGIEKLEGEPIEWKVERIVSNKEPITDGAPEIYSERKDGVISAYNIRTDRWVVATDAMNAVAGSIQARRDEKGKRAEKKAEPKVIKLSEDSGTESVKGAK